MFLFLSTDSSFANNQVRDKYKITKIPSTSHEYRDNDFSESGITSVAMLVNMPMDILKTIRKSVMNFDVFPIIHFSIFRLTCFDFSAKQPNGLRYLRVGGRGFCLGAEKTRSQKNACKSRRIPHVRCTLC